MKRLRSLEWADMDKKLLQCRNKRTRNLLDDQISELPDEILVSILSLLSLKEAARTSVLSSRWRYLWTFFYGDMSFNEDEWKLDSLELVHRINEIMKLHKGRSVEGFSVDFSKVHSVEDIDHWIEFVSKKSVNKFKLKVGNRKTWWAWFQNKNKNKNTCWSIHLADFSHWSFESLKILHLVWINVSDDVLQHMLSNFPNLEELQLRNLNDLSKLSVPGSSLVKLKNLSVLICDRLKKIHVSSRSLEIFSCYGYDIDIDLKEVPQLNTLYFGDCHCINISELVSCLCRNFLLGELETLQLDYVSVDYRLINMKNMKNFRLPKLKHLHLIIGPSESGDMLYCMHILEAAPVLHTLEIELEWLRRRGKGMEMFEGYMRLNRSIRVVKVTQFLGFQEIDLQFVKALIHNIESLDKLIVAPYRSDFNRCAIFRSEAEEQANNNVVLLSEKGFLPPGVELIIEKGR